MVNFIYNEINQDELIIRCSCITHCTIVSFIKYKSSIGLDVHVNYKHKSKKIDALLKKFVLLKDDFDKFKSILVNLLDTDNSEIEYTCVICDCILNIYSYKNVYGIVWYLNKKDYKKNNIALDITFDKDMLNNIVNVLNDWSLT